MTILYGARWLADRPDLAPVRDRGQRAEGGLGCGFHGNDFSLLRLKLFCFRVYHKINGNDLSICQNLRLFFFFFSLLVCPRRVGAVLAPCWRSEKRRRKDTVQTLESGESYQYRCPTHVGHWYFAKNGVSVQPSLYVLERALLSMHSSCGNVVSDVVFLLLLLVILVLLDCKEKMRKRIETQRLLWVFGIGKLGARFNVILKAKLD